MTKVFVKVSAAKFIQNFWVGCPHVWQAPVNQNHAKLSILMTSFWPNRRLDNWNALSHQNDILNICDLTRSGSLNNQLNKVCIHLCTHPCACSSVGGHARQLFLSLAMTSLLRRETDQDHTVPDSVCGHAMHCTLLLQTHWQVAVMLHNWI